MDWARAIERNREALEAIIATLVALLEQAGGAAATKLPRAVYRALLSLLRPAEAAVRRLIVIAALGLTVKPAPPRPKPAEPIPRGKGEHLAFPLLDPRKDFSSLSFVPPPAVGPRIRVFGYDSPVAALFRAAPPPAPVPAAPPSPAETAVDARRVALRIAALKHALANLPRQALRLARWRARREKLPAPKFRSPLRPGRPPGQRQPPKRDIDYVLAECHALAIDALRPNTS